MSVSRLAPVVILLFAACAAWDSASPSYATPPEETPTPTRPAPEYTPPPPVEPRDPVTTPPAAPSEARAAIASVQWLEDCPDPADESAPAAASMHRSAQGKAPFRRACSQSTVQLAVHSDRVGQFRVTAVRVLDAASMKTAGTSTLRLPTQFAADTGTYTPWDERVLPGKDMTISYKLAELDLSGAHETVGSDFNAYMGPFILELDVTIGGRRQTIRSPEFMREPVHVMVT